MVSALASITKQTNRSIQIMIFVLLLNTNEYTLGERRNTSRGNCNNKYEFNDNITDTKMIIDCTS